MACQPNSSLTSAKLLPSLERQITYEWLKSNPPITAMGCSFVQKEAKSVAEEEKKAQPPQMARLVRVACACRNDLCRRIVCDDYL
jgi:hypothetical protein